MEPLPSLENILSIELEVPEFSNLQTANIYALGRGPVTLIDTGPKFDRSLGFLTHRLKTAGLSLKDVNRIILTHAHIDHAGLVTKIREAAGREIECYIHKNEKWSLLESQNRKQAWNSQTDLFCRNMAMPREQIDKSRERFRVMRLMADPVREVTTIEDGHRFEGDGYRLITVHTPGHTIGGCCFYEPDQKILFSGDTLIKHITPIPLPDLRPEGIRDPDYTSLPAFRETLNRLSKLEVDLVLTGHGKPIKDLPGLISSYLSHHQKRRDEIQEVFAHGPLTAFQAVKHIFPRLAKEEIFLSLVEINSHLEVLILEGKARIAEPGPPALFIAVSPAQVA